MSSRVVVGMESVPIWQTAALPAAARLVLLERSVKQKWISAVSIPAQMVGPVQLEKTIPSPAHAQWAGVVIHVQRVDILSFHMLIKAM